MMALIRIRHVTWSHAEGGLWQRPFRICNDEIDVVGYLLLEILGLRLM